MVRFLILGALLGASTAVGQWTAVYRAILTPQKTLAHGKSGVVLLSNETILFNQLIVSFNAKRPARGEFFFYVRVRNAATGVWSSSYKMCRWGAKNQRTYLYEPAKAPKWCYVRLQMPDGQLADAVEIAAHAQHGAHLQDIHAVFAATTKEDEWNEQHYTSALAKLPPVVIKGLPRYSQMLQPSEDANRICAPTSLAMMTAWVTGKQQNALKFAKRVYDPTMDAYGNWLLDVAHTYDQMLTAGDKKYFLYSCRLSSFTELHAYLQRGLPVVVSVRGPLKTMPSYVTSRYRFGHILVVIGWDPKSKRVIVHDPSFKPTKRVLHAYPISSFLRAWGNSRNFAMTLLPQEECSEMIQQPVAST